jgi:hypothetical protein
MSNRLLRPMVDNGQHISSYPLLTMEFTREVDAEIPASNWRAIFSLVNGGLTGESFTPSTAIPEARIETAHTSPDPCVPSAVGDVHNHDGVTSSLLAKGSVSVLQVNNQCLGAFHVGSQVIRGVVYFGTRFVSRPLNKIATLYPVHANVAIAHHVSRFGASYLPSYDYAGYKETLGFVSEVYAGGASMSAKDLLDWPWPTADTFDHVALFPEVPRFKGNVCLPTSIVDSNPVDLQWLLLSYL